MIQPFLGVKTNDSSIQQPYLDPSFETAPGLTYGTPKLRETQFVEKTIYCQPKKIKILTSLP